MKLIHAIIDPARLDAITEALGEAGIFRLTIAEVEGVGHHKGHEEVAGASVTLDFLPRLRLEIAVNEPFVQPAIDAIRKASAGNETAPGVILVLPLSDVIRIRSGERGPEAI